jgi:drug/metabolite transporter (DMT)-like permease
MVVILLVIASAFCHALWNTLMKKEPDAPTAGVAGIFLSALFCVLPLPFEGGPYFAGATSLLFGLGAGVFEAGYIYTLGRSLARFPLSVVYPIARGGALLVVWPVSVFWLGEPFHWWAIPGILCLWVGLYLCAKREEPTPEKREALQGVGVMGLWLAGLCAACIGGYNLCYKVALQNGATPIALCAVSLVFSVPLSVLLLGRGAKRLVSVMRERFWSLLLVGFLSALSFLLFVIALRYYDAGASMTLRNVSIVFAQLLSLRLGERPSRLQWLGALLVTVGAIVVNIR